MSLAGAGPVLLVGAGKMGLALARGWVRGGLPAAGLSLVDPEPGGGVRAFAAETGATLRPDLPAESPRAVVLAVKPQVMGAVLAMVRPLVGEETLVMSIAAGISLETLAVGLGSQRLVRAMPNTPAQIGRGIAGAVAGLGVKEADRTLATALLEAGGDVVWLEDEALIDAVTAVSGSGPAYVFHMVEALAAAGEKQGLSASQALLLARRTVIGAAALLDADPADPGQLRENVTSPGGTTQAALDVLMGTDGLRALIDRAVAAARKRSEELGG